MDRETLVIGEAWATDLAVGVRQLLIVHEDFQSGSIDSDVERIGRLRGLVAKQGWKGRKVVLGASAEHVILRHLSLPKLPERALRLAVKAEVQNGLRWPFEDPLYDFAVSNLSLLQAQGPDEMDVIVVAAPRAEVEAAAEFARALGLRPVRMDLGILAARRIATRGSEIDGLYAILTLSGNGVELGVFWSEYLLFLRHVPLSVRDYATQAGAVGVLTLFARDLARELERSLNFLQYNLLREPAPLRQIYIIDKFASAEAVAEHLRGMLEYEFAAVRLADNAVGEADSLVASAAEEGSPAGGSAFAAVAAGLSLADVIS